MKLTKDNIVFLVTVLSFALPILFFFDKVYDRFNDGEADRKRLWKYSRWQHEVLNDYADRLHIPRPSPPSTIWDDDSK